MGNSAFWEAEYRLDHKPVDVLCEADDICNRIKAISSEFKDEFGMPLLSKWYDLDAVPMHADLNENAFEEMISEFEELANQADIYADSVFVDD